MAMIDMYTDLTFTKLTKISPNFQRNRRLQNITYTILWKLIENWRAGGSLIQAFTV